MTATGYVVLSSVDFSFAAAAGETVEATLTWASPFADLDLSARPQFPCSSPLHECYTSQFDDCSDRTWGTREVARLGPSTETVTVVMPEGAPSISVKVSSGLAVPGTRVPFTLTVRIGEVGAGRILTLDDGGFGIYMKPHCRIAA